MRQIESASSKPENVIKDVLADINAKGLHEYLLPTWLQVTVINSHSSYFDGDGRAILYEFHEQLPPFVDALYALSNIGVDYTPTSLDADQLTDPAAFITHFFQQLSMDYGRRKLSDFVDAGIDL